MTVIRYCLVAHVIDVGMTTWTQWMLHCLRWNVDDDDHYDEELLLHY
jgi:hypothetical protein